MEPHEVAPPVVGNESTERSVVARLNTFFDWLFQSRWNPLYRSGTWAVVLLAVLIVTGIYLLLFYRLGAPYDSVATLQGQWYLGRWIRSLHRFATDGVILATLFHILQLAVQRKTWGPRLLAWISGVFLLGAVLLCAWTGYVMVWDLHGQALAIGGAQVLQKLFPFLDEALARSFDGSTPLAPSFFFMNMFLHIAVPLGITFMLWIHTSKLARAAWLPEKRLITAIVGLFTLLALVFPVALLPKADLLKLVGRIPWDFWVTILIPNGGILTPLYALLASAACFLGLLLIPAFRRPVPRPPVSIVDVDKCTGCTQCARDCPYEAIQMIPHSGGRRLLAQVTPETCVSCGICAASCADLAIGPPGRGGEEQLARAREFVLKNRLSRNSVIAIACSHNSGFYEQLMKYSQNDSDFHLYPAQCCGTVHTGVHEILMEYVGGIVFSSCPPQNCYNRDGLQLATMRFYEKRVPFLSRQIDRNKIKILSHSSGEAADGLRELFNFVSFTRSRGAIESRRFFRRYTQATRAVGAAAAMLLGLAAVSTTDAGLTPTHGVLRVSARLPSVQKGECKPLDLTTAELTLSHMQLLTDCEVTPIKYHLEIFVDGNLVTSHEAFTPRADRFVSLAREVNLDPGRRSLEVRLTATPVKGTVQAEVFTVNRDVNSVSGEILLVTFDPVTQSLLLKSPTSKQAGG